MTRPLTVTYVQCSACAASLPAYLAGLPQVIRPCPLCKGLTRTVIETTSRHHLPPVHTPPQIEVERRTANPAAVAATSRSSGGEAARTPPVIDAPMMLAAPFGRTAEASQSSRFDFGTPLAEDLAGLIALLLKRLVERSLLFSLLANVPLWDLLRLIAGSPPSGGKK